MRRGRPGSTRRWRYLRAQWATRLPLPCTRCGRDVLPDQAWHLDHGVKSWRDGGSDLDARPAHAWCNLAAGARPVGEYPSPKAGVNGGNSGRRRRARISVGIGQDNGDPPPITTDYSARSDDRVGFSEAERSRTGYRVSKYPPITPDLAPLPPNIAPIERGMTVYPTDKGDHAGGPAGGSIIRSAVELEGPIFDDLALTPGPDDRIWDSSTWLDDLRAVPGEAYWPRVMTGPHPLATGSYGLEVARSAQDRTGLPLRWWQVLALTRLLEHDADGALVWPGWLLSTARQVGKSWLLRELFIWRIHQADRFGEPQLVLHTGKDLPVCREIQRPARVWARGQTGYTVRDSNGMEEIETPDGSRWLIRGRGSVYGYSSSLGAVDEAWKVDTEIVEDGIEPTMVERASSQLGLISTAHRQATALMPDRRAAALEQLIAPTDSLIVEWSASSSAALDDPRAWHQASPHWSTRRERLVRAKHLRALAGASEDPDEPDPIEAFRTQWLNIWPERRAIAGDERIEPLIDEAIWPELADLTVLPVGPLVLALEDYFGRGAGAAASAVLPDGRVMVWGRRFDRRAEARDWLAVLATDHPESTLLLGATLSPDDVSDLGVSIERTGPGQTRKALPRLRELVADRRLVHDGGAELAGQVIGMRVTRGINGLSVWAHSPRSDLARAAAWAVEASTRAVDRVDDPEVF